MAQTNSDIINKWGGLSYKDKLSYSLAIAAFSLGWIITFIAFFVPPIGLISDSVLWVLGQALLFTGAVTGIAQYYQQQLNTFKKDVINTITQEYRQYQEQKLEGL